ncbi:phage tail protein [Chromobacterium phragmitis]|uniref:Phage tail protein n=1 Tax=Chromobacterium phragmitis TaxID=2202141 RepID=A0ABV0IQ15_9NEIS
MQPIASLAKKAVNVAVSPPFPLPAYRFVVFITAGAMPFLTDVRFQSVSGLAVSRTLDWEKNYPSIKTEEAKSLTLSRGLTSIADGAVSALALANLNQLQLWDQRLLAFDILVASIDMKGVPKAAWKFERAILTDLDWGDLNAENGQLIIEKMTFSCKNMRPFTL